MRTWKYLRTAALALGLGTSAGVGSAADRVVGIVPSDGVAMLVKSFAVDAGATITGVAFENNGPATVFPEVVLLRGPLVAVGAGAVLASAANVSETAGGVVVVTWPTPVAVSEPGTYYVGVCPPAGPGKQGPGLGPALGANDVETPNGSYLTCGPERTLVPIRVELAMSLLASASGSPSKAGPLHPEEPPAAAEPRTFLRAQSQGAEIIIAYGLAKEAEASLRIYDVAGRLVRELGQGILGAGAYERTWDGRDARGRRVSAGIYFVRLQAGSEFLAQKILIAR